MSFHARSSDQACSGGNEADSCSKKLTMRLERQSSILSFPIASGRKGRVLIRQAPLTTHFLHRWLGSI